MKEKGKKKFPLKAAVRLLLLVLCGAALGVNLYMANAKSLVGDRLPMPFGYGAAVVLSGSMEPELSVDDLIVVAERGSFAVGDVVVYQDGGSLVVHRVIAIDEAGITTKGDANNSPDEPIDPALIKGTVIFHVPGVGVAVRFLKSPIGIACLIAAVIALLEIPRRREKKADDAKKQAILDEIKRLKDEMEQDSKQ